MIIILNDSISITNSIKKENQHSESNIKTFLSMFINNEWDFVLIERKKNTLKISLEKKPEFMPHFIFTYFI